jgi:hypothetical protein
MPTNLAEVTSERRSLVTGPSILDGPEGHLIFQCSVKRHGLG